MSDSLHAEAEAYQVLVDIFELPAEERDDALARIAPDVAVKVRSMLGVDVAPDAEWVHPLLSAKALEEGHRPTQIGPYRILDELGEGGMGRVYLAEQEVPVRRRVALKVLRFRYENVEMRARFEAERQAMGRLQHPNVGLLLDAGNTEEGLPYFAMELIEGAPITEYCDARSLGLEERLSLVIDVCRGVEHAHQKLLLHRDIKPSNILVAEHDRPVPKLIDFGIAKGIDRRLVDTHLATGARLIGTPEYMSPEALGLGGEVDFRSDVFSLGVLLYELLTGIRPWQTDEPSSPARRLKDRIGGPLRPPSSGLSRLDRERRIELAARRRLNASQWLDRLRGDLDRIVLKAVADEPERRYRSAAELADDLERYLRNEPVSARRPTAGYLIRKLVDRNRPAVLAAALALAAIVVGILGTSFGLLRAREAERLALAEANDARLARDEAEEVTEFLIRAFRGSGVAFPNQSTPPAERSARQILESGAALIDEKLADRPLAQARLKVTIGEVYRQLGLLDEASAQVRAAVELYRSRADAHPRARALAWTALSTIEIRQGRLTQAKETLDKALAFLSEGKSLSERERTERQVLRGKLLINQSKVLRDLTQYEAAEAAALEAIDILKKASDHEPLDLPTAVNTLATVYFRQARWPEAEARFRDSWRLYQQLLEPGHPTLAAASENVAIVLASQGRLEDAAPLFERSLIEKRAVLGDEHYRVAEALNNLGRLRFDLGQTSEAEALHREALAIREQALGPNHARTAWSLDNLAHAVAAQGRIAEALDLQHRAATIREQAEGASRDLPRSLRHLSELYQQLGQPEKAEPFAQRAAQLEP